MALAGRFVRQNLFQQIRIHFKEMRTNNDILFEGKWRRSSSGALCSLINHLRARHRTVALGAGVQLAAVVFYPHFTTHLLKMAEFAGKYKLVSSENFDEYMKAVGVGFATRKLANAATPVQEIQVNGDEFYIKTSTTFKTTEIKFKLGEEFDETTADGRQVKTVITKNGNKLIQEQKGDKPSTIVREFDGDTMKMTLTVGDITSVRVYKKEE